MPKAGRKLAVPGYFVRNAVIFNPVLAQMAGLCPIVAIATSVRSAALMSLTLVCVLVITELLACVALKKVPRWVRIGLYIIIGAAVVTPVMLLTQRLNSSLAAGVGMYLPLMAVNSLVVMRCERYAVKLNVPECLRDALTAAAGYSAVTMLVGGIREVLVSASFAGVTLWNGFRLPGLVLPFGGFLILGFLSALLRVLISERYPTYLDKKAPKAMTGEEKQQLAAMRRAQASSAAESAERSMREISEDAVLQDYSAEDYGETNVFDSEISRELFALFENTDTVIDPDPDIPQIDDEEIFVAANEPEEDSAVPQSDSPASAVTENIGDYELEKLFARSFDDIIGGGDSDKG